MQQISQISGLVAKAADMLRIVIIFILFLILYGRGTIMKSRKINRSQLVGVYAKFPRAMILRTSKIRLVLN